MRAREGGFWSNQPMTPKGAPGHWPQHSKWSQTRPPSPLKGHPDTATGPVPTPVPSSSGQGALSAPSWAWGPSCAAYLHDLAQALLLQAPKGWWWGREGPLHQAPLSQPVPSTPPPEAQSSRAPVPPAAGRGHEGTLHSQGTQSRAEHLTRCSSWRLLPRRGRGEGEPPLLHQFMMQFRFRVMK